MRDRLLAIISREGEGTTFYTDLPLNESERAAEAARAAKGGKARY